MATGGNSRSYIVSSDENQENQENTNQENASAEAENSVIVIFRCNPCTDNQIVHDAHHYCPTCDEYYCDGCVRFHRRMALLKDHVVYGKSDKDKWGQNTSSPKLTEKCDQHPTESVTMVCETCNKLCCHVCISIQHSNCTRKEYIPTAAEGILESSRKREILTKVKETSKKASDYKNKLDNLLEVLSTKQTSFLEQINNMREQADEIFNEMENRVSSLGNTLHENISEDIKTCDDLTLEMNTIKENLQNAGTKAKSEVLIDVVKAENGEIRAFRGICETERRNITQTVDEANFTVNADLNQILQQTNISLRIPYTQNKCICTMKCLHKEYHLNGYIEGICQIPDGTFMLVDSANFCMIQLGKSYTVKTKVSLEEPPSAVCNTEPKYIAVSLKCKLHVFRVDKDITRVPTQDLTFNHRCCGLAYNDNKYYISDQTFTVYVYDTNGTCQKQIETHARNPLFQAVRNIAIGKEANKIYVTDIEKGLITMDLDGNVLSTLETDDTNGAYGVCVTNTGNVLVTNYLQDKVIEVDQHGTTILNAKYIALPNDTSPRAICFDSQTSHILISENQLRGSHKLTVIC